MNKFYYLCAFLFLALIIYSSQSFAQDPQIEWQKTLGGNDEDRLGQIQQTSDGGYILGGTSWSDISGDKIESSQGFQDFWVVKLDASGNIQWQNTIGGSMWDGLNSISQTTDGGYICGGWSYSGISGDKTENVIGNVDCWVLKLDKFGNIEWQNNIGGSNNDWFNSVQQTADGGYICGGYSDSGVSVDKSENNIGFGDYWVVKLDSLGTIQWENTIGGKSLDDLLSIEQTFDGGYICGGWSFSDISGDKTENKIGSNDFWVVKLDSTGTIQWQNTIGGTGSDELTSIQQTPDGGYICGGFSSSDISGDKTEDGQGGYDYWIIKLDSIGNIDWQNTIGGSKWDQLYSVEQTVDGGYICGGHSLSNISGDKTENSIVDNSGRETNDYWMVKLDDSGNIQWQNTIGGSSYDELVAVQQTLDGGYICGGYSSSNISGDKTENSEGEDDYWIIKLNEAPNLIFGHSFLDLNFNNIKDASEPGFLEGKVQSIQQNDNVITNASTNGVFYVQVDTGTWVTSFNPNHSSYVTVNPISHTSNFGNQRNQVDSVDFAVQLIPGHPDLCIELLPLTPARPGFNVTYRLIAKNIGTDTINGDIIFSYDSMLTIIAANPSYTAHNHPELKWNFVDFAPLHVLTYDILFSVPPPPSINNGDLLSSSVVIYPVETDEHSNNNFDNIRHEVTGSYDPNDKWVSVDIIYSNQLPYSDYLDYLIRFQNTGTDTAFRVAIKDTLDYRLDETTLNIIHTSHEYVVTNKGNSIFEFQFNNILLPDSNVNEPESHGYIAYQIKPKQNISVGDIISNRAAIYFDYNLPIITNSATTEVVILSNGGNGYSSLIVYPNPSNGWLIFSSKGLNLENVKVNLYNSLGQLTPIEKVSQTNVSEYTIDVRNLARGVYQLVVEENEKYTAKIIIE